MNRITTALHRLFTSSYRLSVKQKTFLFRQLSYLIESGYSTEKALYQLKSKDEKRKNNLHKAVDKMIEVVQDTGSLTQAVGSLGVFEPSVVYQVESGEISGELPVTLMEISRTFEVSGNISRSIAVMMIYPMILVMLLIGAAYILSSTVMPQILAVVRELDIELSSLSKIVMAASDFISKYTGHMLIGLALCVISLISVLKIRRVRYLYDRWLLNAPFVKNVVRMMDSVRYASVFYSLFQSGVELGSSLDCAAKVTKNLYLQDRAIESKRLVIEHGLELAEAVKYSLLFDETEIQLIDISVSTDKVCEVFKTITDHSTQELEAQVKALLTMIEPAIIVVLGLILGLFVMGIYSPIISITTGL